MPSYKLLPLLATLIMFMQGCAATYETWPGGSRKSSDRPPAPVVREPAGQSERPAPESDEPVFNETLPEPVVVESVAQPTGPAGFLLDEASRKRASGDLVGAATAVERAMRIQAGNPWLSLELASIRLEQGNPAQAELLAQRALAQAGGDRSLQDKCWSVTASARQAAGDTAGAAAALARMGQ